MFVSEPSLSLSLISFNSARAETTLSVNTPEDPILEISLSSNLVQLDLVPKPNNPDLKSGSITVSVGTNNIYGYSLFMDVDNTNLTRTQAINNTTPVIASLADNAEGYTDSTFTANRWGYRTDNGNYFAIPSEETLLNSYDDMINQDSTTITFASKVDMNQPAGTYSTDVNLVAVVNPEPVITMQNIDTWRGSLAVNQSIQATDERDGKQYWVLKARDGHIWMTQNLDFDIDSTKTYTPADTDITANWTPVRGTWDTSTDNISGWVDDDNTPYSVSTGDWFYTDTWYPVSECPAGSEYIACSYLTGNANGKFSQTAYYGNGAHGSVGNYYNWSAAVAMNNSSSYSGSTYNNPSSSPQTSICPAGWRLPIVASSGDEFQNLFTAYNSGSDDQVATASPLFFPRVGYLYNNYGRGHLYNAGRDNTYWSSTVYTSGRAYRFADVGSNLSLGGHSARYVAGSIRCIAR